MHHLLNLLNLRHQRGEVTSMRLLHTLLLLLGAGPVMWAANAPPADPAADSRFKIDILLEDIPQPMELEIAHDGRIFFI